MHIKNYKFNYNNIKNKSILIKNVIFVFNYNNKYNYINKCLAQLE